MKSNLAIALLIILSCIALVACWIGFIHHKDIRITTEGDSFDQFIVGDSQSSALSKLYESEIFKNAKKLYCRSYDEISMSFVNKELDLLDKDLNAHLNTCSQISIWLSIKRADNFSLKFKEKRVTGIYRYRGLIRV